MKSPAPMIAAVAFLLGIGSLLFAAARPSRRLMMSAGGRAVAGQLVDAAEQHRHMIEPGPGPSLDVRNQARRQIGVRAAEIEQELDLQRGCIAHSILSLSRIIAGPGRPADFSIWRGSLQF